MSNFAESHSLPTFKERKAAKGRFNNVKWLTADRIVDEVYVDLVNGLTKSDIIQKLGEGLYENQKRPIGIRAALEYIAAAHQRLAYDFESTAEELRADMYAKLTAVYADAVKHNDRYNAIQAIQTLMKLTGVAKDKQQNNIQINNNKDGITIHFGFTKDDDNTEEVTDEN